jgi:hypothetical protein
MNFFVHSPTVTFSGGDTPGVVRLQLLIKVPDKGDNAGIRRGLVFRVAVLGKGIGEVLEATALPVKAYLPGKPGSRVNREQEGLRIVPSARKEGFLRSGYSKASKK